jgi:hypothetical protein
MGKPGQVLFLVGLGAFLGLVGVMCLRTMGDRSHTYVFVNVGAVKLHVRWGEGSLSKPYNFDLPPGEGASVMYFGVIPPVDISTVGGRTVSVNIEPFRWSSAIGDDFYRVLPIDQTGKVYDLTDINKVDPAKSGL